MPAKKKHARRHLKTHAMPNTVLSQPIERIVFCGGGAKGIVYPGICEALLDARILQGVKEVAGVSAGSFIAAMIAIGASAPRLNAMLSVDFHSLLGATVSYTPRNKQTGVVAFITRDGVPLENHVRHHVLDEVSSFLSTIDTNDRQLTTHPDLNALKCRFESGNNKTFTFGDLAVLQRVYPKRFKSLTVTAINIRTGETQVFNSTLTPDVDISLACRASGSIPVFFKPVKITINGQPDLYIDGAVYNNYPTEYFDLNPDGTFAKNQKKDQTLILAFSAKENDFAIERALFSHYIDETLLKTAIQEAIQAITQKNTHFKNLNTQERFNRLLEEIKTVLKDKQQALDEAHEKSYFDALLKIIEDLFTRFNKSPQKMDKWKTNGLSTDEALKKLGATLFDELQPAIFNHSYYDRALAYLVLRDFNLPYDMHELEKQCAARLNEYGHQVITYSIWLHTLSFETAQKCSDIMFASAHMRTIQHLHDYNRAPVFEFGCFYYSVTTNFETIYNAILAGSKKSLDRDPLLAKIHAYKNKKDAHGKTPVERYARNPGELHYHVSNIINTYIEENPDSSAGLAQSLALQYSRKKIDFETVFKQVYKESFARSSYFSKSEITGKWIFRSTTLETELASKNMLTLFKKREEKHRHHTRAQKIYAHLKAIAPDDYNPGIDDDGIKNAPLLALT